MGQATKEFSVIEYGVSRRRTSRGVRVLPPLAAGVICTALIIEAIHTILGARSNGDVMVIVCPALGAIFLSIPAAQAWWAVFQAVFSA